MSDVMLAQVSNPRHEMELPDRDRQSGKCRNHFLGGIVVFHQGLI